MTIEFKATADYNSVVAELDKTRKANEKLHAELAKGTKGANDAEKAQLKAYRELQRFAEQTGRAVQTSHEKHRAELDKLKAAFDAGLLSAEQYGRGVESANQRAAESYDVVAEAVENTAEKQETTTNKSDGLNAAIMKGIGGFASYQAILSKVSEALQYVSAQTEKAKESFESMADPRRRLSQIADAGTPGRSLDELEARVDTLAARYGENRQVVAGALFSAVSEGFESSLENLVRYGDVVSVASAASVAGQVPTLFRGAIGPEEAVSTTLLAARQSRLDFEQIAAAMPTIASGASMTGATPTEAMGVLSVMASRFGSGSEAATPFRALSTRFAISEPGEDGVSLAGRGLVGGVEALQAMDEESRREFLGESQELNVAYQMLSESLPEVRQRIAELDEELATMRAGGPSTLERQYQEVFGGNTEQAQRRLALERQRQAEITREIANERQLATVGLERQAAIDEQIATMQTANESTLSQFAVSSVGGTAQFLGADEAATNMAVEAARRMYGADSNAGFIAQPAQDVATGGISVVGRMAGVERPTGAAAWLPQSGPFGMVGGAVQAGLSFGRGGDGAQTATVTDQAAADLLIEQRRANQQAAEQMAEQTRALQAIATGGPRSGTSTLTQPQLAAQAIPR